MDFNKCTQVTKNKKVCVSEKGRKFVLDNSSQIFINKIKVDGCLINDNRSRCDWLFETLDNNQNIYLVIYVELKGKSVEDADKQLSQTIELLKNHHKNIQLKFACMILTRYPRGCSDQNTLKDKYWKRYKIKLHIKGDQLTIDSQTGKVKN